MSFHVVVQPCGAAHTCRVAVTPYDVNAHLQRRTDTSRCRTKQRNAMLLSHVIAVSPWTSGALHRTDCPVSKSATPSQPCLGRAIFLYGLRC